MSAEIYAALKSAVQIDVVDALQAEQEALRRPKPFLLSRRATAHLPVVYRLLSETGGELSPEEVDELQGRRVSWVGLSKEQVVTIDVHDAEKGLVSFKGLMVLGHELPPNTPIWIWERDFLTPVLEWWKIEGNAHSALRNVHIPSDNDQLNETVHQQLKSLPYYSDLSETEKAVLEMACRKASLLVGPPGSGKTTRLSKFICTYMEAFPKARILILSYTNRGTDELNLRVAQIKQQNFHQARVGRHYDKAAYEEFPDLLVKSGDPINSNLDDPNEYFSLGPYPGSAFVGVYAMTCYAALQRFHRLKTIDFDLVVLDEASQVASTQGLPLLSLGRSVIIAGDDIQLNPVCKTRAPEHFMFNGVSPFILKYGLSDSAKLTLREQYRMPFINGKYISDEFYDLPLTLAECLQSDEVWQQFRRRRFAHYSVDQHLIFESVTAGPMGADGSKCRRVASAERIVELIASDTFGEYSHQDIAILTPFNSQVHLLRDLLKKANLKVIVASTTHVQQGAQFPLVFFDPVNGSGAFMRSQVGDSIINVAASRAQSKCILVGDERDCRNPRLLNMRRYSEFPNQLLGR